MTCIVAGIEKDKSIVMGCDSAAGTLPQSVRLDSKIFIRCGFLIGFTDSFRMGQLLRYTLAVDQPPVAADLHGYMATHFIDSVRKCLKDGGWAERDKEKESGGTFLVGVSGRLFCVYSDYQVEENADEYNACGCGADTASGAMFATRGLRMSMRARVKLALKAAANHSGGVSPPFRVLTLRIAK